MIRLRTSFKMHKTNSGICYFSIPLFDTTNLVTSCFTTRMGGVSEGPYHSLNFGLKTMDKKENVIQNFSLLCKEIGISLEQLVLSDQVHKDNVRIVTQEDMGKGLIRSSDIHEVDALITNVRGIGLVTIYADCVPIFLFDPVHKVIALAHAGWRGTVLKISSKVLKSMVKNFDTSPEQCLAAIGPSIGQCCYEVDEPVIQRFEEKFHMIESFILRKEENDRYMLDLWKANQIVLEEAGILKQNIAMSNICTACNPEMFFSHRMQDGVAGRMAAIMVLL